MVFFFNDGADAFARFIFAHKAWFGFVDGKNAFVLVSLFHQLHPFLPILKLVLIPYVKAWCQTRAHIVGSKTEESCGMVLA